MIARVWRGVTHPSRANEYHEHLLRETFPQLRSLDGFKAGFVMRQDLDDGIEFLVITHWDALADIRAFAGDDIEVAVIPDVAQAMMVRHDKAVRHYDLLPTTVVKADS